jgi:hypothetical protein
VFSYGGKSRLQSGFVMMVFIGADSLVLQRDLLLISLPLSHSKLKEKLVKGFEREITSKNCPKFLYLANYVNA